MNAELQRYYESRFEMLGTQGWKDLMDDIDEMLKATDRIGAITTIDQLHFRRGELSMMNWLKSLKDMSESAYEELK